MNINMALRTTEAYLDGKMNRINYLQDFSYEVECWYEKIC